MSESNQDFVRQIITADRAAGKHEGRVHTRFPPEPNGYLHIGHAKSICLNFGIAQEFGGKCNLRFDDTNPEKEDVEYVECIKEDVRWLGFDWEDRLFFASDYFQQLFDWAVKLVEKGKAYVDSQSVEEIRKGRGMGGSPGVESPYRDRSSDENLDLLMRMKAGEFEEGSHVLRAKIDMAAENLLLRDPVLYRIRKVAHHRTGEAWCIYPTYDWAHGQSDSIENITHSVCTLEFVNHRPLYDWCLEELEVFHPQQIEFARLNINHMVMSKRKLLQMVEAGHVSGWDDPRMPTLIGMRRRGFTPAAIRKFCEHIGVAKFNGVHEMSLLEFVLREDLNKCSERRMAVVDPIKVTLSNYPEGKSEDLEAINNPGDESAGKRMVPFSRQLYIERADFMEDPPKKYFRLAPGREVRLRYAYFITCQEVIKDDAGEVVEIICSYDPATRGGDAPDGRKVKGTIHWVSAAHAVTAEVREYDHLFNDPNPDSGEDGKTFLDHINPDSLRTRRDCQLEPSLENATPGQPYQFERLGYFCVDSADSAPGRLVFNRTVGLRDSWAKKQKK